MHASLKLLCAADGFFSEFRRTGLYGSRRTLNGYRRLQPDKKPTWVSRLTGWTGLYFEREFISGNVDYTQADKLGNDGLVRWYVLSPGVYEVHERISWKEIDRRFLWVTDGGKKKRITKEAAICLVNVISG